MTNRGSFRRVTSCCHLPRARPVDRTVQWSQANHPPMAVIDIEVMRRPGQTGSYRRPRLTVRSLQGDSESTR